MMNWYYPYGGSHKHHRRGARLSVSSSLTRHAFPYGRGHYSVSLPICRHFKWYISGSPSCIRFSMPWWKIWLVEACRLLTCLDYSTYALVCQEWIFRGGSTVGMLLQSRRYSPFVGVAKMHKTYNSRGAVKGKYWSCQVSVGSRRASDTSDYSKYALVCQHIFSDFLKQ